MFRDLHQTLAEELVARLDRVAACSADKTARCRGSCHRSRGCRLRLRLWRGLVCRRRRWWRCLGCHRCWCRCCHRVFRDFHEALAAELIARLDRVAACMTDKTACRRSGCHRSRRRGRILRLWWWRRRCLVRLCCCQIVRDFHEALAAELVARPDRVAACTADGSTANKYHCRLGRGHGDGRGRRRRSGPGDAEGGPRITSARGVSA